MNDLTAFLAARLDEREAAAKEALRSLAWMIDNKVQPPVSPAMAEETVMRMTRVLSDVAADRAILAMLEQDVTDGRERDYDATEALGQVVRIRAAIWDDHPGYRQEWKP